MGDFNDTDDEHYMKYFCENYGLKNLIRQTKCYKTSSNPVCVDLVLTNVPRSFQSTCVVETGLSDFHFMTLTVMSNCFNKYHPKIINYRSSKNVFNEKYREKLINNLSKENFTNNDDGFQRFCHISLDALTKHAPRKKKNTRGNQTPFSYKEVSKIIMTRTKLRNIFLQNRSEENRINEKFVVDNKLF